MTCCWCSVMSAPSGIWANYILQPDNRYRHQTITGCAGNGLLFKETINPFVGRRELTNPRQWRDVTSASGVIDVSVGFQEDARGGLRPRVLTYLRRRMGFSCRRDVIARSPE